MTRRILERGLELVQDLCEAEVWPDELPPSQEQLIQHVVGVDGLLCLLTDRIDVEVMNAAGPQLRIISNHAVGVDNVDVAAATARGIPVGNTPDILTDATADMAFALLLAAGRRVVEGAQLVKAGGWKTWGPGFMLGADLSWRDARDCGFWPHWARRCPACKRVQHAHPFYRPIACSARTRCDRRTGGL